MSERAWRIHESCPQCGGPVDLQDDDRLLECAYCRVRLHIAGDGELRYCLPSRREPGDDLTWIPYWRFRGTVYSLVPHEIVLNHLDVTRLARPLPGLPPSLGVRPQALSLRFATRGLAGRFLAPDAPTFEGVARGAKAMPMRDSRTVVHRSWLAPLATIVYLPVWHRRLLVDAIIDRKLAGPDEAAQVAAAPPDLDGRFGVRFLATLCPHCGWALDSEPDSVVLLCRNCRSAWIARHASFERVPVECEPVAGRRRAAADDDGSDVRYLPFWRSHVAVDGVPLRSYADLVKFANLPRVVQPGWADRELSIWTPAFHLNGEQFFRFARTMTVAQPETVFEPSVPPKPAAAVTLTPEMVASVFVTIVAGLATPRHAVVDLIDSVRVTATDHVLVFLPFRDTGRELVRTQPPMRVGRGPQTADSRRQAAGSEGR